jgi:hypothetical protein
MTLMKNTYAVICNRQVLPIQGKHASQTVLCRKEQGMT